MSVQSFNAVCDATTHTLVLGTMPGVASINAAEYYAHKRNAFWPIMIAMLDDKTPNYQLPLQFDYQTRIKLLLGGGIGLWDVLASCERPGSLDSAIKSESIEVNDFVALLNQFSQIRTVAFNGKTAEKLFNRHALPVLTECHANMETMRWLSLPSTSPAMAVLNLDQKYKTWRAALMR